MTRILIGGIVVLAASLSVPASAEIANRSAKQLQNDADAIVVGKVQAVRESPKPDGDWIHSRGTVALLVTGVEKGDAIATPGKTIEVSYWRQRWTGSGNPPPFGSGHRPLPKKGDVVRAYLDEQPDKTFEAVLPNGFEILPAAKAPVATKP